MKYQPTKAVTGLPVAAFATPYKKHIQYNINSNCGGILITYNDGSVLTIDCEEVENHYDVTNGQMANLDWLLYNAPMEYASLVLSGEMENYLKGPALHGIED